MDDYKEKAKQHVHAIYSRRSHEDIEAWDAVIDILFEYVKMEIKNETNLSTGHRDSQIL